MLSSHACYSKGLSLQLGENLVLFRKASLALLREQELAVVEHVELAFGPRDDGGGNAVGVQYGRETRGPFVVAASDGAVLNLDGHAGTLLARPVAFDDRAEVER